MNLVYSTIDPSTATIEEIQSEINRLNILANIEYNAEQAIKIFINSVYGSLGNKYFVGFDPNIAEAVTTTGRELILHAEKYINLYFKEQWHVDRELHSILNIDGPIERITEDCVVYIDTDSNYVTFDPILESCNYDGNALDLILGIYRYRLKDYFVDVFNQYAKSYGTKNLLNFELEDILYSGIWMAKKKYVKNVMWEYVHTESDGTLTGRHYVSGEYTEHKGVEIVRTQTPKFAREQLKDLTKWLLMNGKNFQLYELVERLSVIKKQYMLVSIDDASMTAPLNDYVSYVLDDTENIVLASGCPVHIRAAATYNYLLKHSEYKNKYPFLQEGDRFKWYYTRQEDQKDIRVFGFLPNEYPQEILPPPMDYDVMFEKVFINPINRFLEAMNIQPITRNLTVRKPLW